MTPPDPDLEQPECPELDSLWPSLLTPDYSDVRRLCEDTYRYRPLYNLQSLGFGWECGQTSLDVLRSRYFFASGELKYERAALAWVLLFQYFQTSPNHPRNLGYNAHAAFQWMSKASLPYGTIDNVFQTLLEINKVESGHLQVGNPLQHAVYDATIAVDYAFIPVESHRLFLDMAEPLFGVSKHNYTSWRNRRSTNILLGGRISPTLSDPILANRILDRMTWEIGQDYVV